MRYARKRSASALPAQRFGSGSEPPAHTDDSEFLKMAFSSEFAQFRQAISMISRVGWVQQVAGRL